MHWTTAGRARRMRARSKVEEEEESEEEDEIEEDEDTEVRRSPRLVGTPVAVSPAVVPILVPQGRRVRGVEG